MMSRPSRPILKRNSESPSSLGVSSYGSSASPKVHFPPPTSLTSTYSAHSASVYDRSPIKVSPNACAMPERGCPGRTYMLDAASAYDDNVSPPPSPSNYAPVDWRKPRRTGSPARVRVVGFDVMGRYRSVQVGGWIAAVIYFRLSLISVFLRTAECSASDEEDGKRVVTVVLGAQAQADEFDSVFISTPATCPRRFVRV